MTGIGTTRLKRAAGAFLAIALCMTASASSAQDQTASASEINAAAKVALEALYAETPAARGIASEAQAILVFPEITKAGLIVGGQFGNGVLLRDDQPAGHYNIAAASLGLQAGVQTFSYVMMFIEEDALNYLDSADGWEIGVGPTVVAVDTGAASSLTTATLKDAVYSFTFGQEGLMAGLGLQGSKITPIEPAP